MSKEHKTGGEHEVTEERAVIRIGCAGWSIPSPLAAAFGAGSSHLARYATRFSAAEINSSFYRSHQPATYQRWRTSVPEGFLFSVKVPRTITHHRRLVEADALLEDFLEQCGQLGPALGPLLLQLPPSLKFDEEVVSQFMGTLRERFEGYVVCEPRHASWFCAEADDMLTRHMVARVAADPEVVPGAATPGGWSGIVYYRLHGSPRTYYSSYQEAALEKMAAELKTAAPQGSAWCIFDNTASGAAAENALLLQHLLASQ